MQPEEHQHAALHAGRTPLHYAAMHGRVGAVEALVAAGASMQARDLRSGYTPLHLAADAGQCEALTALVKLGAPLEEHSASGWTPLALATFKVLKFAIISCMTCLTLPCSYIIKSVISWSWP